MSKPRTNTLEDLLIEDTHGRSSSPKWMKQLLVSRFGEGVDGLPMSRFIDEIRWACCPNDYNEVQPFSADNRNTLKAWAEEVRQTYGINLEVFKGYWGYEIILTPNGATQ